MAKKTTGRRASAKPGWHLNSISNERKLDVLGVILALTGLLTLLSLVSRQRGDVTGAWVTLIFRLTGWGTFILPVLILLAGLWLVFRNVEKLPLLSAERLVGLALLYLNVLTWMHLLAGGGWDLANQMKGGGYLGALFEQAFTSGLGTAGAVVVLVAWLLIALGLTFDLSIPDLFRKISPFFSQLWKKIRAQQLAIAARAASGQASKPLQNNQTPPGSQASPLPPEFHSLNFLQKNEKPAQSASANATAGSQVGSAAPSIQIAPQLGGSTAPSAATPWVLPVVEAILDPATPVSIQTNLDQDRAHLIEETLASFGSPAHVVDISRGPTVTQFGVEPEFIENRNGRTRVRVSKIVSLADDLALALAAPRIRIQAPVPGRNYVGIEVPNPEISRVTLREVLESEAFQKVRAVLRFALGQDVAGRSIATDLSLLPHLLIAGTTGSGKSVCVNSILCCLLMNNTPVDLRVVLVDPKRVELTNYNGIPHLLAPVVVEAERVVGALQWMQREMDARYHKFAQAGVRNIHEYNQKQSNDHLPFLVVVIDELADLMMLAPDETERSITRLAQLARATGIHLILATQRPSVDVVTGLIKANFPARIAFAVASNVDSRVILDQPGAERLLGRGDMLYQAPDASAPVRLQGTYVSESEIQRLVDYWRLQSATVGSSQVAAQGEPVDSLPRGVPLKQTPLWEEITSTEDGDPLLPEAIDLIRREGRASITLLQRKMRIGYTRAARLIDTIESKGIIGPSQTNSPVREVLDYGPTAPPKED
ncbi:MAG TPA: DNA translocase FtsK 4TM domain-containing protein [Anaerolineaceae bacterium]|nr:DNA translocase FtsK 4TM domain-containing protein [Anaerolineaceae bacterium]